MSCPSLGLDAFSVRLVCVGGLADDALCLHGGLCGDAFECVWQGDGSDDCDVFTVGDLHADGLQVGCFVGWCCEVCFGIVGSEYAACCIAFEAELFGCLFCDFV